jgi:hypothetical protein
MMVADINVVVPDLIRDSVKQIVCLNTSFGKDLFFKMARQTGGSVPKPDQMNDSKPR